MAEKKTQETVETKVEEKEETKMAEEEKKETKEETKAKEKEGLFKRFKKGVKKHRHVIEACVSGIAIGIGGTLGVEKIGEKWNQRKYKNQPVQTYCNDEDECLSPNVDE